MSTLNGRGDVNTTGDDIILKDGETDQVTISAGDNSSAAVHSTPDNSSVLIGAEHGGDNTKKVAVDSSGATTSTKTTIAASQTANRTISLPDATDTLVGKATTDTLTNKTIVAANNTITTAASGNLTSTNLNAALAELQTDIDTRAVGTGAGNSTDNAAARYNGTDGAFQDSGVIIDDSDNVTGISNLTVDGYVTAPLAIGDPGTETGGVNIDGTTYDSALKINDIGGSEPAQLVIHRHSTTYQAIITGSRSNSDDNSHSAVTNGMTLFEIMGTGWTSGHYDIFASIRFLADASGTISGTSSPGTIDFRVAPNGSDTPASALTIRSDKKVEFKSTTATTVPYLDSNKALVSSAVTPTELGYVSGVTSAIQTQINSKQPDVITTRGDVLIGNSSGAASRLAIGTANQILVSDGTDVAWAANPSASAATPDSAGVVTSFTPTIKSSIHSVSSADYTVLDDDGYGTILVTTGATGRTITLPTLSDNVGRKISIVKADTGAGTVTVDGEGAETINADTTRILHSQYSRITLIGTSSTWYVLEYSTSATVTLDNDFTGGTRNVTFNRIGNSVSYTSHGVASHSGATTVASSSGLIPSGLRPSVQVRNSYATAGGIGYDVECFANGTIQTRYESTVASTGLVFSGFYVIF